MTSGESIFKAFFLAHPWRVFGVLASGWAGRALAAVLSLGIGQLLARSLGKSLWIMEGSNGAAESTWTSFFTEPGWLIGCAVAWLLCRYFEYYQTSMLGELLVREMREDLFRSQMKAHPDDFRQKNPGKYLLRYSGDLKQIQLLVQRGMVEFGRDVVMVLVLGGILVALNGTMGLLVMLGFAVGMVPILAIGPRLYRSSEHRRNTRSGLLSYSADRIYRHRVVQALNRATPAQRRYDKRSTKLFLAGRHYYRIEGLARMTLPALTWLLPAGLLIGWLSWSTPDTASAALPLAIGVALGLGPVFRRIGRVNIYWTLGRLSLRKLMAVVNQPPADAHPDTELHWEEGVVELSGFGLTPVGQTSPIGTERVEMKGQGVVWIEGGNGSGKSHLIGQLLRLRSLEQGQVRIDGRDITECSHHSVRKQMAVVSDDFPLVGKTVFEAISYSRRASRRDAAERMLGRLQAALPSQLQLELDQRIEPWGEFLASSQRTLLIWARALLTRKPLVLVDDPFRGLDAAQQAVVLRQVKRLRKKRLFFICAHTPPPAGLQVDQHYQLQGTTSPPTLLASEPSNFRHLG